MTRTALLVMLTGVTALALPVLSAPARADDPPPDFGNARFAFYHNADGYLRLDTRTGEVAACDRREVGWTCVLVPDERTALDGEIARLQRENAALKSALLAKNIPLPDGMAAAAGTAAPAIAEAPASTPKLPVPPNVAGKSTDAERLAREDAEIDRMLNVMSKVWRRLVEMMMSLQRDMPRNGATPG
jgi:hypothetical protein